MYLVALALLCYAPSVGLPLLFMSFGCLAIALLNVTTVALPLLSNSIPHLLPYHCFVITCVALPLLRSNVTSVALPLLCYHICCLTIVLLCRT